MAKLRDYKKIVIAKNATYNERRAAIFLSNTIKQLSSHRPELIFDDTPPSEREIVIGRTAREEQCAVSFLRGEARANEFEVRYLDERLYLTGLGTLPEKNESTPQSSLSRDGAMGTIYAVYYFVDKIMGHSFIYRTKLDIYLGSVDIEIDESCNRLHTHETIVSSSINSIKKTDGTMMYFYTSFYSAVGGQGIIFRTKEGKLVVIDGGLPSGTEAFLDMIDALWDGEGKPVISAWLFSHMHVDHFGIYRNICLSPEYISRIRVENFYCDLLDDDFYIHKTYEPSQMHVEVRHLLMTEHKELGVKVHTVKSGEHIKIDELDFAVVHTPSDVLDKPLNPNDSSVVYKLTVDGKQTILFLADGEAVVSDRLLSDHRGELKSDVVQVGHHGVANVSGECYNAIGAKAYLYSSNLSTWYLELGNEICGSHDPGMKRQHYYMNRLGVDERNVYTSCYGTLALPLPLEIK